MAKPQKKRGVLYVIWNRGKSKKHDGAMQRSINSLYTVHPELGIHIHELPSNAKLLDKARMYDWSPFEETLYLDIDTVVMDRLDYGFEKAAKHHVAVAICEAPFARRYHKMIAGDMVEYNTGVIFWKKGPEAEKLFREWERLAVEEDSSHEFPVSATQTAIADCNDQASFAKAVDNLGFLPFILPNNWNFRAPWTRQFYGPLKVWHDYSEIPAHAKAASDKMKTGMMFFHALG
ncbi:MAG: hypothetical protein HEQ23_14910 [Tepidisphaera sp.]|jgi:hypothetical protein